MKVKKKRKRRKKETSNVKENNSIRIYNTKQQK